MDTIFMNSKSSNTSEPYVLIFKLADKLDLRRGEKSIALSNLSIFTHGKQKIHTITINLTNYQTILLCIRYSRLFEYIFKKTWRKYW